MRAEIISIGDELTTGQRLDTNSQWLSQRLGELGVRVLFHTTVGDERDANVEVFRTALQRADVIVSTGGLGPTADDLTREALAEALQVDLVTDEEALSQIRALFARRQRPMPPQNAVQSLFPRGSRPIPNPHGTAPGIDWEVPRPGRAAARGFCLPGVPAEMREMWAQTVEPAVRGWCGSKTFLRQRCLQCFGVGESELEQMLPDLIRRGRVPTVGITVSQATISLRILAEAADEATCQALIAQTEAVIRQALGSLVFGEQNEELQQVLVRRLEARGETLAVAEIGTGGLISQWLSGADAPGTVFRGGWVLRAGAGRDEWPGEDLARLRVARDAADRVRQQLGADYGIFVGPFPDAEEGSQAVYFAWSGPHGTEAGQLPWGGHPDVRAARYGKHALNELRLRLERLEA